MNLSLLNSLCYTAGWFWCVLFGIHDQSIAAAIGTVVLILLQLYYAHIKDIAFYIQDVLLVIFSIPLGALLEIFFIQTNLIHYANTISLPPLWIVCLYPLFSLLLNHSMKIIKKNYITAFLFGFVGAPLSYIAGISLGGLTLSDPFLQTWLVIGISWGFFLCLLTKITYIIKKAATKTLEERNSKTQLELLYDGECPICKREVCILQKKEAQTKMKFTDISSKKYSPLDHRNIGYNRAMSQIHAIEEKGNILVGIPAFTAVYARCNLLVTSTFLRIPFIKRILEPLYTLFARKRLWMTGRVNRDTNQIR